MRRRRCAIPAPLARELEFVDPPLPDAQREALTRLGWGSATKLLVAFSRCAWRRTGWPRAWATNLPVGAIWDGAEEQPGPGGVLAMMAGGSASAGLRRLWTSAGVDSIEAQLEWLLGGRVPVRGTHLANWDDEPWSRGGYAVFGPSFDPAARDWLSRAHGRIVFAGEQPRPDPGLTPVRRGARVQAPPRRPPARR